MNKVYKAWDDKKDKVFLNLQSRFKDIEEDFDFFIVYSKRGKKLYGLVSCNEPIERVMKEQLKIRKEKLDKIKELGEVIAIRLIELSEDNQIL